LSYDKLETNVGIVYFCTAGLLIAPPWRRGKSGHHSAA